MRLVEKSGESEPVTPLQPLAILCRAKQDRQEACFTPCECARDRRTPA